MSRGESKGRHQSEDDRVFKALAGRDRRRILDVLRDGPLRTSDVARELPRLDRTTVMQHLRVLETAGLVISKKEGRCRWYYLDVSPIQGIHERWIRDYATPSARLLARLKRELGAAVDQHRP